jgi:hypothetical protein
MADRELSLRVELVQPTSKSLRVNVYPSRGASVGTEARALPPPAAALPDLGEGFDPIAREAIQIGAQALADLREHTVERWLSAGAALTCLRNVSLAHSGGNAPAGKRYNQIYAGLSHAWPKLARVDKATRSNAIWLFENSDFVLPWLATLSQKERDRWTHPAVIRRHYKKRHPDPLPDKPVAFKPCPTVPGLGAGDPTETKQPPLEERSREDLEILIAEQAAAIAERERTIMEMNELIAAKDREIAQLRNDLAWEKAANRQLSTPVTPRAATTAARSNGELTEVVHAGHPREPGGRAAGEVRSAGLCLLGEVSLEPCEGAERA